MAGENKKKGAESHRKTEYEMKQRRKEQNEKELNTRPKIMEREMQTNSTTNSTPPALSLTEEGRKVE